MATEGDRVRPLARAYARRDSPVHYALADAFTVCDHYFCSVMGPTDPNRLFWISGTIDPEGQHGGPLLHTLSEMEKPVYSWRTYPEVLEEAAISWKVYQDGDLSFIARTYLSSMLDRFKAFQTDSASPLVAKGIESRYPAHFREDVMNGTLPLSRGSCRPC